MICVECGCWFEENPNSPGIPVCDECGSDIALSEEEEVQLAQMEADATEYNGYLCEAMSAGAEPLTLSEWLTQRERVL